jgi:hypothetical protein
MPRRLWWISRRSLNDRLVRQEVSLAMSLEESGNSTLVSSASERNFPTSPDDRAEDTDGFLQKGRRIRQQSFWITIHRRKHRS